MMRYRGVFRSFLQSHFDFPTYLLWLSVTALLFQFTSGNAPNGPVDDEFSEFEDPDDTFGVDLADTVPSSHSKHPKPLSPENSRDPNESNQGSRESVQDRNIRAAGETQNREADTGPSDKSTDGRLPFSRAEEDESESTVESEEDDDKSVNRDDEEFEGLSPSSAPKSTPKKGAKPKLIVAKVPHHLTRSWDNFHLEIFLISILVVYFLNYLTGRAKNTQLATAWFETHKPLLEANFAMVGDDGQTEPGTGTGTIMKESEHLYSLWCSGRIYCEAMLVELRLIKRQCLLFVLANWVRPTSDTIIAKVIMEDSEMDGWVMAVGRKRRLQLLAKDHLDLAFFCPDKRGQRHPGLPESLIVMNEIPEACTTILSAPVCKFLSDHEDSIEYLFFSDQYTGPKPSQDEQPSAKLPVAQKVLIFGFRVGSKGTATVEDMESSAPLFQFIFYMIDKVHRLRLSKESKSKSDRNRQRAHDSRLKTVHTQRQEAAQTRREERMRAVKERIMAEEDPEKARKLEEREQRKEKAKKMPKMKMLKSKAM